MPQTMPETASMHENAPAAPAQARWRRHARLGVRGVFGVFALVLLSAVAAYWLLNSLRGRDRYWLRSSRGCRRAPNCVGRAPKARRAGR
jgi:hypothetical protein